MPWQYTPYLWPLVIATGISIGLASYALRYMRRNLVSPTVMMFSFLVVSIATYASAYAVQLASTDLTTKLTWFWIYNVAAFAVPIVWLVFALAYAGRDEWITSRLVAMLSIIPAITLLAYLVPGARDVVLADYSLDTTGGFVTLAHTFGPLYLVQVAYSYVVIGMGAYLIAEKVATSQELYRGQALALLVGVTVPSVAHVSFMLELTPLNLDFTPTAFTVSGLAFGFAVFRYQLFDVLPVARTAIVEEMSDGVVVLDPHRRVVDINPVAQSLVDDGSAVLSRPLEEVLPDCASVIGADRTTGELVTVVKGTTRHFDLQVTALYDSKDRFTGHLLLLRDVTRRKEYEQRLEALQEATHDLMEAETTDEVCDVAATTASEVLELPLTVAWRYEETADAFRVATDADRARERLGGPSTCLDDDAGVWRTPETNDVGLHGNGRPVSNSGTATERTVELPLGDLGMLVTTDPVTRTFDDTDVQLGRILARTVEAALDRASREQMLRTRERELTTQNKRLDEFARVISHDLRNPLNVASGYAEVARKTSDEWVFDNIDEAHERMGHIIEDVLVLAREGKIIGETETVSLHALVADAWESVETMDATLNNDVDHAVMADSARLRRLFENLFRNAVEHAGPDVTITVGPTDTGFSIADDGPGIPVDLREQVFDPGYSGSSEGTGLGLSIVRQIATAHGWTVRIAESHDGTRFEISDAPAV